MKKKKKDISMDKVTDCYETFIKGKQVNNNGKEQFDKAINKSTKQRGSK